MDDYCSDWIIYESHGQAVSVVFRKQKASIA